MDYSLNLAQNKSLPPYDTLKREQTRKVLLTVTDDDALTQERHLQLQVILNGNRGHVFSSCREGRGVTRTIYETSRGEGKVI